MTNGWDNQILHCVQNDNRLGQSDSSLTLRMTVTRHFDRAKASGEIPKSYALTQGDFSTALEMTVNQGIKGAGMINAKSRGFKNGGGNFHKRILCLFIKTLDEGNI